MHQLSEMNSKHACIRSMGGLPFRLQFKIVPAFASWTRAGQVDSQYPIGLYDFSLIEFCPSFADLFAAETYDELLGLEVTHALGELFPMMYVQPAGGVSSVHVDGKRASGVQPLHLTHRSLHGSSNTARD